MAVATPLTIVIPSYRRGASVVTTLQEIGRAASLPDEILVIDQTELHPAEIAVEIDKLSRALPVRVIMLSLPSIPAAMNRGLLESRNEIVLFLDDDATPEPALLDVHIGTHREANVGAVAGRILQPDSSPRSDRRSAEFFEDLAFDFTSSDRVSIRNVMAGNLSVKRSAALGIGGFDENFVGVAYRFETDFARRLTAAGHSIIYEPEAVIHHRREPSGGTRAFGDHRRSSSPAHSAGDYYFALRHLDGAPLVRYAAVRLRRNVLTRYHLRHPWWIPAKLIGEVRGLVLALRLSRRGPRFLTTDRAEAGGDES